MPSAHSVSCQPEMTASKSRQPWQKTWMRSSGTFITQSRPRHCFRSGRRLHFDERFASLKRLQWPAVLDEMGDAQRVAAQAEIGDGDRAVLVEPVGDVRDESHRHKTGE